MFNFFKLRFWGARLVFKSGHTETVRLSELTISGERWEWVSPFVGETLVDMEIPEIIAVIRIRKRFHFAQKG